MRLKQVSEGKTKLFVPDLNLYKKKEKAPVFYNPVFSEDRELSVLIFKKFFGKKKVKVADLLCATGARGIKYAHELGFDVTLNDARPSAIKLAEKNAKLNKVKVKTSCNEANKFLLSSEKFDLIDIDPFGSPVYFLSTAFKTIKPRKSMIALSATDLGTLSGYYPKACFSRYGVKAVPTLFKHELGLRNLIACAALQAARQEFGIKPIFAYTHQHYYRIYLEITKPNLKDIGYYLYCEKCGYRKAIGWNNKFDLECICGKKLIVLGPTWIGKLGDYRFMKQIISKFVNAEELQIAEPYYDLHKFAKLLKTKVPKTDKILEKLKKKKFKACRTKLCLQAIKTTAPFKRFLSEILQLKSK